MQLKTLALAAALCLVPLAAGPASAQGIAHTVFMRGQIVSLTGKDAVLCIGKEDGAAAAQVLDVYRVSQRPGVGKGAPTYLRTKVGSVTINDVFDDHFARATVTDGAVARHDIVELRSQR